MNERTENSRIKDLRKWPNESLRRRLNLDQDMEGALISVGSATGELCSSLCEDVVAIKNILKKQKQN